jgi:hypothetical protein
MRSPSRFEGKTSTRRSLRYFRSQGQHGRLQPSLYAHMLTEDLHLGIMPIGGKSHNTDFAVVLRPHSEQVEQLVSQALPSHFGREDDLTRALCHFMDEAAGVIAYYGTAFFEIVYYKDANSEKPEAFAFERVVNNGLINFLGVPIQFVPRQAIPSVNEGSRRFVRLRRRDMMILQIPRELGGRIAHRRLISNLQWLGRSVIPDFVTEDMAKQKRTKGYEFSVYKRNQSAYLARATRHLGWPARQSFNDESLEYYQVYRILRFQKSKALLREHIMQGLNQSLHRVGRRMGFDARIAIEGIPRSIDYDRHILALQSGELSFEEAMKLAWI